jgi:hypothetical protein
MPTEHLYHPVRICDECYVQLESSSAPPLDETDPVVVAGGQDKGEELPLE